MNLTHTFFEQEMHSKHRFWESFCVTGSRDIQKGRQVCCTRWPILSWSDRIDITFNVGRANHDMSSMNNYNIQLKYKLFKMFALLERSKLMSPCHWVNHHWRRHCIVAVVANELTIVQKFLILLKSINFNILF